MRVIKKNGNSVFFERGKIQLSLENANRDVADCDKVNEEQIESIICCIEDLDKKRILVEDIQDMVEEKLIEMGKDTLAREYIGFGENKVFQMRA